MRAAAADVVRDRDLGRCMLCGHAGTDGHHRDPVGSGGSSDPDRDAPERVVLLCRRHHSAVHLHPLEAEPLGYYLTSGSEAYDQVPVWSQADLAWYLLLESGVRVAYPNFVAPDTIPEWVL